MPVKLSKLSKPNDWILNKTNEELLEKAQKEITNSLNKIKDLHSDN